MAEGLEETFVGVGKAGIFADDRNADLTAGISNFAGDRLPDVQVWFRGGCDLEGVDDLGID